MSEGHVVLEVGGEVLNRWPHMTEGWVGLALEIPNSQRDRFENLFNMMRTCKPTYNTARFRTR